MKRGCSARVRNDQAREKIADAIKNVCGKLFSEADRNTEPILFETLKIECKRDIDPAMIRVEGFVESVPRVMSYDEMIRMYCEQKQEARMRAESMPQYDGLTGRMEEL